jgi:DNA-binding MarR family transcriptional regulator
MEEIRKRLSERELHGMQALFALRAGAQQMDNALNEWLADTAGSFARFQILMALFTRKGREISHKEIVNAMGVTRDTVSGLMAALERDGW